MKKKWLGTFFSLRLFKVKNLRTFCLIFGLSVAIQLQVNAKNEHEVNSSIMTEVYSNASDLQNQQEGKAIKGTVVDEAGVPIPGVTIIVKGTTVGTVTDMDGQFNLQNVPDDGIISVSFIGMQSVELAVAGQSTFNITMKAELQDIDEVVVIGYGVQKKSSLTGAISKVKSEDMVNRTITRPEQALQGKTAGVQVFQSSAAPGSSPTVRVRGISSNGSNDPLYVVDGRIMDNIGGIDPNDIESMEVLKDAASAAIYGSAAGNGVVLISTKKGEKGKGRITYDYQFSTQRISRIPKVLNSEQYVDYMVEGKTLSMDNIYKKWDFETNTDWSDVAFESSVMQRHNLSFQGGGDQGRYYVSLSYLDNNGYVKGDADTYERLTTTINANYNVKPWIELGTNTQMEYYNRQAVAEGSEYGSLLTSVLQLDPLTPSVYAADQLPAHMLQNIAKGYSYLQDENGDYYATSAFFDAENTHPLIMRDLTNNKSKGFNINGTLFANLKLFETVTFTSRLGYRLTAYNNYTVNYDFYATSTRNQNYISLDATSNTPIYYQWENFINYNESFNKHSVSAMLGTSFIENRTFGVRAGTSGGENDFGVIKDDPLYHYLQYSTPTATRTVSGGEEIFTRTLSYFGRLSYDYNNKYLAQFSLRADAKDTSVLPMEERWGYFPAASVGWVVSNESFMEEVQPVMSFFKFRASWGQNGTTASLGNYMYATSVLSSGSYPFTNGLLYSVASSPTTTGNNELKWETSEQTNIGIDSRFLNDRLSFSVDYFLKKTKDLIMPSVTVSTIVGNTAAPVNAGNVENQGFEFELGWKEKIGEFSYGINANMATLKNKVTYIHESLDRVNGVGFHTTSGITAFEKGYPAWYFRGYQLEGIDSATGDPVFKDNNEDGLISEEDRTNIGSGIPDLSYGITINAAYKGFDLIVFGTGTYGNEIFYAAGRGDLPSANILKEFYNDRWTVNNTNGTKPRAGANGFNNYWVSDAVIYDGSFFRIKQMQLGYSIRKSLLSKIGLESMRMYTSFDDWFTFSDYPGFDPEVTGTGNALGVDKGSYPSSKKVVFGLNVTF